MYHLKHYSLPEKITSYRLQSIGNSFIASHTFPKLAELFSMDVEELRKIQQRAHFVQYFVPKPNGGKRLIETPSKEHQKILKKLNLYLHGAYYSVKPASAYGSILSTADEVTPKNIYTNALQHIGKKWLLHLDIKDFFHNISSGRISEKLKKTPFKFNKTTATFLSRFMTNQGHLPIGASTSPTMANIVCIEMDIELTNICKEKGWTYTRYIDDLCFSGLKRFKKKEIETVKGILEKNQFRINKKKTQMVKIESEPVVTGLVLRSKKPDVSKKFITNLETDIKIYHELSSERIQLRNIFPSYILKKFRDSIYGRINFLKFIRGEGHKSYLRLLRKFLPHDYRFLNMAF